MRNIVKFFTLILPLFLTSCLTYGLEELPAFEDAEITSVSGVNYRYISEEIAPGTDIPLVKDIELNHTHELESNDGVIRIKASVRDNFPASQLEDLDQSKLVVMVSLSTAARLFPIGDSPKLGVPGDWSKPNTYEVVAANGNKKRWTIEVVELIK